LVALGKLADALPSPAATPISIGQTPQALSPSTLERGVQDGQEQDKELGVCLATPPDGAPSAGDKHDSLPTDEMHCHVPSQEVSSQHALATPDSTGNNEGSGSSLSVVQEAGLEHDGHRESMMAETTAPEAVDGAVQDSVRTANVAQTVLVEEPPESQEDISSPPSSNTDSQSSAGSRPRGRKRTADTSTPEPESEKRKKKSTADRDQEALLERATRSIDAMLTVQDIIFAQERFALLRRLTATQGDHDDDADQHESLDRKRGLRWWWSGLGLHEKGERWEKSVQRVFAAHFYGQYVDDREAYDEQSIKGNLSHPIEMYVDVCSPETIIGEGETPSESTVVARAQAKRNFENKVQRKKLWIKMQKRYDAAVFLMIPETLQEDQ
jgi:hypothetical protein